MRKKDRTHLKWGLLILVSAIITTLYIKLGWYLPAELSSMSAICQGAAGDNAFAGSESCRECHAEFYELWSTSHHGLAMQPFTPEFSQTNLTVQTEPLTIGQNQYQAHLNADAGYVTEIGPDGRRDYPIEHAMGGKNVYFFLTPLERGRLQVLPLAYDVQKKEWYDTAASMVRHAPDLEDEALDWKHSAFTFNSACYRCHVSQLDINYDLDTDTYQTTWAEPGISCETCHGPSQAHNDAFRAASPDNPPEELKLVTVMQDRGFTAGQVDSSCAPCHAKMIPLSTDFMPGDDYFDHYDLVTLEDRDFYPDARDLGENFTYTLWRKNPCSIAGQMDCMHCHTSSGRYRFSTTGDRANASCLPCHEERVQNAPDHTHHAPDSPGNRCIACHMPMTEFARMRRSDHSMRPPMPAATQAFGSPNACNLCHEDKDAAWADATVRQWRQRDFQKSTLEAGRLIQAARQEDWSRLDQMIDWIQNNSEQEIFVNSLVRLMRYSDAPQKWPLIIELVQNNPSPLVRSSAAESLRDHLTRETVAVLLKAVKDPYRLVRIRAAYALASIPEQYLSADQQTVVRKAKEEYVNSMTARPDDAASHYNLGNFYQDQGLFEKAIQSYKISWQLQEDFIPAYVNASMAYNATGRNHHAVNTLKSALQYDPNNVAVHLNLALLHGEMGQYAEAEKAFRRTFELDPTAAAAAYNLGVLRGQDDIDQAIYWCAKAYGLEPVNSRYAYTLAYYYAQQGRFSEVIDILQPLVDQRTDNYQIYIMLAEVYTQISQTQKALEVLQIAVENPRFDQQTRVYFQMRMQQLISR